MGYAPLPDDKPPASMGIAADTGSATGTETRRASAPFEVAALLALDRIIVPRHHEAASAWAPACCAIPTVILRAGQDGAATLDVISQGRLDLGLGAGAGFRASRKPTASCSAMTESRACRVAAGHQGRVDRAKPHLRRPVLHL